jgi:hypothetical protein
MTSNLTRQYANDSRTQFTAFGLAAIVSLSLLAAVLQIANTESDMPRIDATLASTAASQPAQQVQTIVITGKRQAQV